MVLMKLKTLQSELENVEGFRNPVLELEQYLTSSHIAAHMMYNIEMNYEDIEGHSVVDLGCGTGMLTIAASLLGASYCLGVDINQEALDVCLENRADGEFTNIDLVQMNVQEQLALGEKHPWFEKFDTVITNPPFGTKQLKGIDIEFVKFGLLISKRAVYSLHKSSHTTAVMREIKKLGVNAERTTQISFDLPKTYKIHKHNSVDVAVEMLRFTKK